MTMIVPDETEAVAEAAAESAEQLKFYARGEALRAAVDDLRGSSAPAKDVVARAKAYATFLETGE